MGANVSRYFPTPEEADRWAEEQNRLAARWNLQKTADLGNTPVVRVPVIRPDGSAGELAVSLEPRHTVEQRIKQLFQRNSRHRGYREDHSRRRQRGVVRSLRFD